MKIIIAAQGVKREIEGPFEVCMSRKDATRLRNILDDILRTDDGRTGHHYGWFRVDDAVDSPGNSPPRKWTD